MIPGVVEAKNINPVENLKIAIVGEPGVGKSWLSATAPGPVMFFDFDGRAASLHGKAGVLTKTYLDPDPKACRGWLTFEQDLALFEYNKTKSLATPATYVISSVQSAALSCMNYVLMMNSSYARILTVGAKTIAVPKGYDAYAAEYNSLKDNITRLMLLGNLIAEFHETAEEDAQSTQENPIYTGRTTVYPVRMKKLLPLFNEKWRLTIERNTNTRVIRTDAADFKFIGNNTLGLPGEVKNPNIKEILEKIMNT